MCDSYEDYLEGLRSEKADGEREEYLIRQHLEDEAKRNERKPTDRMRRAMNLCEQCLHVKFEGNRDSFSEVSTFLSEYLDDAKAVWEDAVSSYYSNFDY